MRYGAPSGQHDDCVMALAIAWSAVSEQHRAVYPVAESQLIVQPFPIPAHWPRAYGLDIACRSTAAIWGALDRQSDVLYLYDEYVCRDGEPSADAEAICSRGPWIRGVLDPEGNGRHQMDGYRLIEIYRKLGLELESARNLIESGIVEVRQRMSEGRMKVFASLTNYLEELRFYRRDERGQIVTGSDHLQNATRCLVVGGMWHMRTEPVQKPPEHRYVSGGPLGWMAS
jgi:hypothetical protein